MLCHCQLSQRKVLTVPETRSGQIDLVRTMLDDHLDKILSHLCTFEVQLRKNKRTSIELDRLVRSLH